MLNIMTLASSMKSSSNMLPGFIVLTATSVVPLRIAFFTSCTSNVLLHTACCLLEQTLLPVQATFYYIQLCMCRPHFLHKQRSTRKSMLLEHTTPRRQRLNTVLLAAMKSLQYCAALNLGTNCCLTAVGIWIASALLKALFLDMVKF